MAVTLRDRGCKVRLVAPAMHAPMVLQTGIPFHGTSADPAVLDDKNLWHPLRGFAVVWRAVRPGLRELPGIIAQLPADAPCVIIAHPLALPDAVLLRDQGIVQGTQAREEASTNAPRTTAYNGPDTIAPGTLDPVTLDTASGQRLRTAPRGNGARPLYVVAAYLAPSNIPTVHDPLMFGPYRVPRWMPPGLRRWLWRQIGARVIDPVALPEINAGRQAAQLPPVASLFDMMHTAPDLSVTLFPEWFGPPQPDWPQPLVCGDFALFDPAPAAQFPREVEEFFEQGQAPLLFTHGTGNRQAQRFFALAIAATLALGRRAIFLTPHRDQLPPQLPPQIVWQAYLPLRRCLQRAALIVHHGGIGTTAEALNAGVPQLIVPLAFDQFDNGARVTALGAGRMLPHSRLSAQALGGELAALLALRPAVGPARNGAGQAWERMMDAIAIQRN